MSDALPITPEEIAAQGIAAVEAGAAILHLHARVPETGKPTGDPAIYELFLPILKQRTDAIINLTTGGSATMPVAERLLAAQKFRPVFAQHGVDELRLLRRRPADRKLEV